MEYKEICLKNGKKSVKLESGTIKFKILQRNDRDKTTSYAKKYQDHISCSFTYKVVCINDKLSKPVVLYTGKNVVNKFIEAFLEE